MQRPSSEDMVLFCWGLRHKFMRILKRRLAKDPDFRVMAKTQKAVEKLAECCTRFENEQYWHQDEEIPILAGLANWVLYQHCQLEGIPEIKSFLFEPDFMIAKTPLTSERLAVAMGTPLVNPMEG